MVEVHDPGWERPATVLARSSPQISQELKRRCLANANALDLRLAIGGVVRDVVRPLIALALHIRSQNTCSRRVNRTRAYIRLQRAGAASTSRTFPRRCRYRRC